MQNQPNRPKSPMVKIGGLFENVSKNSGQIYFTGRFGFGAKMLVLKNPERVEGCDNRIPHFNVFVVEDTPKPPTN
jgi:hypothetical protein